MVRTRACIEGIAVMTHRLLLCVLVTLCLWIGSAAALSGLERSLFRTAPAVVDIMDLQLLKVHEAAGLCPWILVAYSDGCGHCRSAAPAIIRRAEDTFATPADAVHEVTVAALNCQVNTQACNDLNVEGVPSFFLLTPDFLEAKAATLSPIALHPTGATDATATAAPQSLRRFAIGKGGNLDMHLDLARTIWSGMTTSNWTSSNTERCLDMRGFLRSVKEGDLASAAARDAKADGGAAFTEERDFHTIDVANAFFYTLYHEVAMVGLESPERRHALFRFLRAVQQRLPGLGADVLLHEMTSHSTPNGAPAIPDHLANFTVAEWQKLVLSAGIPFQGTPRGLAWRTCKGSSWRYRGFPCGQWLLYHALTVNGEADAPAAPAAEADSTEILFIIKDYARSFFSCEACRRHFMRFEPDRETDPVWQLWKVHNLVNYFLANVTDGADPLVPKRQFPGRELCPLCYRELDAVTTDPMSAVVASELLKYLRRRYRWVPSSLRESTSTVSPSPAAAAVTATAAGMEGGTGEGGEQVIMVHKAPMSVTVVLTMVVVVVVVVFAMRYVLRRSNASRAKKHRPILPLRMQP